jgi:hypothetical protein
MPLCYYYMFYFYYCHKPQNTLLAFTSTITS